MAPFDAAVLGLVGLATLRGLWIGLTREVFSLAALAGAVVAVRLGVDPAGSRLAAATGLGPLAARVAAGGVLVVGTLLGVTIAGRLVRRGLRAAGLDLWDRLGGGVLGAAEGVLAAALLLLGATSVVGVRSPALARTRSLAVFERLEAWAGMSSAHRLDAGVTRLRRFDAPAASEGRKAESAPRSPGVSAPPPTRSTRTGGERRP